MFVVFSPQFNIFVVYWLPPVSKFHFSNDLIFSFGKSGVLVAEAIINENGGGCFNAIFPIVFFFFS